MKYIILSLFLFAIGCGGTQPESDSHNTSCESLPETLITITRLEDREPDAGAVDAGQPVEGGVVIQVRRF